MIGCLFGWLREQYSHLKRMDALVISLLFGQSICSFVWLDKGSIFASYIQRMLGQIVVR